MARVKSRNSPEVGDDGRRLRKLLGLLADFPSIPWGYRELAAMLREDGHELADSTPKKWPQRGVPERWGRPIAEAARKRGVTVTAEWLIEGVGAGPHKVDKAPPGSPQAARSVGEEYRGPGSYRGGAATVAPRLGPDTDSALTPPPGAPTEQERLMGLIRDALMGAVERALARDNELEHTRPGSRILGRAFMQLAVTLQQNGVDATELLDVALQLQNRGDR